MDCGTLKKLTPHLCVSVMQIGQATLMIGKVPVEVVSILETTWYHGIARNKTPSLSTAEDEYIDVGSCCAQLLWMKQMLKDYEFDLDTLTIFCDNTSVINFSKNPVQHSRTKHIDIRHHFIREFVENKTLVFEYIETEKQIADIFTKALDSVRFDSLRKSLGVCLM